jgi:MoaA/NifB/PqqE/SkfB family radical SAM enzyme
MKKYTFYIDVFSYCNLRCPTCIVGNKFSDIHEWPKGLMSVELLGRILDKAVSECQILFVGLYNWTEASLHPDLPMLVREVKARGLHCQLSSNLNVLRNPERLLAEGPDGFRVSLSGFTQPVYQLGHRAGDIEKVKHNMVQLAEAKATTGAATAIEVFYHRYKHNVAEMALMEQFALSLGFRFHSILAQIFPVEKIINISEGKVSPDDRATLDLLALPLELALAVTSQTKKTSCKLLDDMVTLDIEGNVMLCCGSSMDRSNVVGNFLEMPLTELQALRGQKTLCGRCLDLGIPDYFLAAYPEFEAIATETIRRHESTGPRRGIPVSLRVI